IATSYTLLSARPAALFLSIFSPARTRIRNHTPQSDLCDESMSSRVPGSPSRVKMDVGVLRLATLAQDDRQKLRSSSTGKNGARLHGSKVLRLWPVKVSAQSGVNLAAAVRFAPSRRKRRPLRAG